MTKKSDTSITEIYHTMSLMVLYLIKKQIKVVSINNPNRKFNHLQNTHTNQSYPRSNKLGKKKNRDNFSL
jgi:hypothetical protein